MFTNSIGDQLNDSFVELMAEIRAMRQELERIRGVLETQPAATPAAAPAARRAGAPKARRAVAATRSRSSAA
jgi:hypothetical protein